MSRKRIFRSLRALFYTTVAFLIEGFIGLMGLSPETTLSWLMGPSGVEWLKKDAPSYLTHNTARWSFVIISILGICITVFWGDVKKYLTWNFGSRRHMKLLRISGKEDIYVIHPDEIETTGPNFRVTARVRLNMQLFEILDSYNLSSVTDNGHNDFSVNFSISFQNTNYFCQPIADSPIDFKVVEKTEDYCRINLYGAVPEVIEFRFG